MEKVESETFKPLGTAIVGCGMISNVYIRNLKNLFHIIDLKVLCDLYAPAAEEKAALYGIDEVRTMDEIAESEDIELVINLTGPAAHYDVIKKMLLAGKHVFTEKMLTTGMEKADELLKIAKQKNLYLGVAPDTVLGAGIQTARKVLDAGFIGKVTSCVACINRNQNLNSEVFRFMRTGFGGALPYDVGIYYVAALLALLGPVKRVAGFGKPALIHRTELFYQEEEACEWRIPGNNLIAGSMEFHDGALGSIHFNGNCINEEQHVLTIYGTEGILQLGNPADFGGKVTLVRPETGICDFPHTHGYDGIPHLPDATKFEKDYGNRGLGAAEMAWAIRKDRPCRCSMEMGYHAMEIFHGFDVAAATGRTYELKSAFTFEPLKSGYLSTMFHGGMRGDAETSLID